MRCARTFVRDLCSYGPNWISSGFGAGATMNGQTFPRAFLLALNPPRLGADVETAGPTRPHPPRDAHSRPRNGCLRFVLQHNRDVSGCPKHADVSGMFVRL